MKVYKIQNIADGCHHCFTCGSIMYISAGNYCSWRCEAIANT